MFIWSCYMYSSTFEIIPQRMEPGDVEALFSAAQQHYPHSVIMNAFSFDLKGAILDFLFSAIGIQFVLSFRMW